MSSWKFPKSHRLKSRKRIQFLFQNGKNLKAYPLRVVYVLEPAPDQQNTIPFKIGFSCPKKNHKKAVDRNYLKRLMRETFRLNQHVLATDDSLVYEMMFVYIGREKSDFDLVAKAMKKLLSKISIPVNDTQDL